MAPFIWLGIVAILTYTGWNLHQDWASFWGGDDDGGGDGGGFPVDVNLGGGFLLLAVVAVGAFALMRGRK